MQSGKDFQELMKREGARTGAAARTINRQPQQTSGGAVPGASIEGAALETNDA